MNVYPTPLVYRVWLVVVLSSLLMLPFTQFASPVHSQAQKGTKRILVDASDTETLAKLQENGAELQADYESFSLWQLPTSQIEAQLQASGSPEYLPVEDSIYLRGITLEPEAGINAPTGVPEMQLGNEQLSTLSAPGSSFWMVQFIGPVQDTWLDTLLAAGLELVAYLPNNAFVVWGQQAQSRLESLAQSHTFIRWSGNYRPEYRLSAGLRAAAAQLQSQRAGNQPAEVDVTIQVYPHPEANQTIERLQSLASSQHYSPRTIAGFTNLGLRLSASALADLAHLPDVYNIEPWQPPELLDEAQGQILAGNLTFANGKMTPNGPGYLEWLASKGFPSDPDRYPVVDIVDDGIDQGDAGQVLHPDFYLLGNFGSSDRIVEIKNCTQDSTGNAVGGHGNLNAGIIAGFNNLPGTPYEDSSGFQYGLGISPFGRIAGTKAFSSTGFFDLSRCGSFYDDIVSISIDSGAVIASNSWGSIANLGEYTASAQAYDALTRDADDDESGNQQMLHVFSAGNSGLFGSHTITPPGTGKNVLTVGATESVRDHNFPDGCGHWDSDSADDIAGFSSRGPTWDNRIKPDLLAPGVHVQGPASQDPQFTGRTVCGTGQNQSAYYPDEQTLYTWSSGTSHSAPAVAGAAQLAHEYYTRVIQPESTPSPAMLKALLINSARYLTGVGAADTLPSQNQGWGGANLGMMFDGVERYVLDQTHVFRSTGNELVVTGGVVDPTKPLRVTLVWTDAPGNTTGFAAANNLDLEVSVGSQTYRGNFFTGPHSSPGGTFDTLNNVESVFLPAGQQGAFKVRVIARNIVKDGLPGNSDSTDQDFALVIYNGDTNLSSSLVSGSLHWIDTGGDIPEAVEPGESVSLFLEVANQGNLIATGVAGTLSVSGGKATIQTPASTYPNILPGGKAQNTMPYRLVVSSEHACGQPVEVILTVHSNPGKTDKLSANLPTGKQLLRSYFYTGPPTAIPDNASDGVVVKLQINEEIIIQNVDVLVDITHPDTGDLNLTLTAPDGTRVPLSSDNGSGANYTQTIFDDEAGQSITQAKPPFTGRFKPEETLSALNNKSGKGTWQLQVSDDDKGDTGQLKAFSIQLQGITCDIHALLDLGIIYLPTIFIP